MGRPSIYSEELTDIICEELAGGKSLNAICKREDMPCIATVMNWLVKAEMGDEQFAGLLEKYLRARDAQADVIFDECLEIADDKLGDYRLDPEKGLIVDGDHIQRAKLRVDTRMRMAGKLKPKKYGDKIDMTTGGEPLNDAKTVDAKLAFLLGKAGIDCLTGSKAENKEPE